MFWGLPVVKVAPVLGLLWTNVFQVVLTKVRMAYDKKDVVIGGVRASL